MLEDSKLGRCLVDNPRLLGALTTTITLLSMAVSTVAADSDVIGP